MGSKEILPYLGLGNIALHSGELPEAEKWFIQARELHADHPAVLLAWGRLYAAQAQKVADPAKNKKLLQEARTCWKNRAAKARTRPPSTPSWAAVYYKLAMWDKAAENYEKALRMRRRRNDLRFAFGQSYAQLGRINDAEQKYREILSLSSR